MTDKNSGKYEFTLFVKFSGCTEVTVVADDLETATEKAYDVLYEDMYSGLDCNFEVQKQTINSDE